jgi:tetratricopeptide (TPR) repeat protein
MSDPLRTDPPRAPEPATNEQREAKIERLLLAGLEHYFEGGFEEAINVWSRALFLDRGHARARAYIERARSAQAERQRASEERLHRGAEALRRGERTEALRLLQEVVAEDGPSDQALALLDRLNRLQQVAPQVLPPAVPAPEAVGAASAVPQSRSRAGAWVALVAMALVIVAAAIFALGSIGTDWGLLLDRRGSPTPAPAQVAEVSPPVPRRGETALSRAQSLVRGGKLRDALVALESVRLTDPQKAEADRLKADVQKQLIELDGVTP